MNENTGNFPTFKGKPLVRCGDTIYYGSMKDSYVVKIDIRTKKKVQDIEIADKVTVQLLATNPSAMQKAIVKTSEKKGLYLALDIADAWLSRALAE